MVHLNDDLPADDPWGVYAEEPTPQDCVIQVQTKFVADAIQCWSVLQNRNVTVGEVALAFNLRPEQVAHAVEEHHWMVLGPGDTLALRTIEHEGE